MQTDEDTASTKSAEDQSRESTDPSASDGKFDLKNLGSALGPDVQELQDLEEEGDESTSEAEAAEILEADVDESLLDEKQRDWTEEQLQSARKEATELKSVGNQQFLTENYTAAVKTYTQALNVCPLKNSKDRAILYQNRGACKARLDQNEVALKDLTKAVELDPDYFKARLKRAQVYEKAEKLDEALEDYKHLLGMDPRNKESLEACQRLPAQINERNEKLKTEMLSKLKDLGNLVLRPFGLSTDHFQMKQDPKTGGYSVSMSQNPGGS